MGPSGFFGVGALFINIKELSWEKILQSRCAFCNTSCRLPFGNSIKMCGQASNILNRINSRKLFMGNSTMAGLWDILCGYGPADPWNSTSHMIEYLVKSNQGFLVASLEWYCPTVISIYMYITEFYHSWNRNIVLPASWGALIVTS